MATECARVALLRIVLNRGVEQHGYSGDMGAAQYFVRVPSVKHGFGCLVLV